MKWRLIFALTVLLVSGAKRAEGYIVEQVYSPEDLIGYGSSTFTLEDFEDVGAFTPLPLPSEPWHAQAKGRGGVIYSSDYGVDIDSAGIWAGGVTPSGISLLQVKLCARWS